MFRTSFQICIIFVLFLTVSCALSRVQSSNEFVERLNSQMRLGNFEQIYNEASDAAKERTSKEEFLRNMKLVINGIKEVDATLTWQKDKKVSLSNDDISTNLYFVHRKIERNGRKLDVTITLNYGILIPEFYDLCFSPSESITVESQICVTNALGKI